MTINARWHKKYQHGHQNMGFMGQIGPNMGQNMGFMDFMGRVDTLQLISVVDNNSYLI